MAEVQEFDFNSATPVVENEFDFGSAVTLPIEGEKIYLENQQSVVELPSGGVKRLQAIIGGAYEKGTAGRALNELYSRQMFGDDSPELQTAITQLRDKTKTQFGLESWSIEDIARAGAEQTPQLLGLAESATKRGLQGAMFGGTIALTAGQIGPQVATPEEIVTVPAASLTGGIIGARYGVAEYSFMQNAGEAYGEFSEFLDKEGVKLENKNLARLGAMMVGATNAGFDTLSLGQLSKVFVGKNLILDKLKESGAKSIIIPKGKEAIFRWLLDLSKAVAVEAATEGLQEGTKGLGGNVVKNLSTQEFENLTADQIFSNMGEAASEAGKATMAMGGAGGVIRASTNLIPKKVEGGTVSDPALAAKALVESDKVQPETKAAVNALTTVAPDFTMEQLQAVATAKTPQKAADIIIKASPDEQVKAAIEALPKGFTMEQLQAVATQDVLKYDNPGGNWLANQKYDAARAYDQNRKIAGAVTAYTGIVDFPTEALVGIPGANGEKRVPGETRYDELAAKVASEGFKRDSPILVGVNSKGEPYIIEGNTRAAVAIANGIKSIPAEVKYYAGGELVEGGLTPKKLNALLTQPVKQTSLRSLDEPKGKAAQERRDTFNRLLEAEKQANRFSSDGGKEFLSNVSSALGKALTPISTRLRNINPKLAARLRQFEFDHNKQINADEAIAKPFLQKFHKLSREDRTILDFAMKNGDMETINEIAAANNMTQEIEALRVMFDDLYKRGKKVNLDIGYRKGFFPRLVEEPKKFLAYFGKTEAWNDIQQAIKNKELELGTPLTVEEKAHLINTLLRGYQTAAITLSKPGALKERSIDQVTPEINQFYATTDQAILHYITTVNDAIETRNFLGKDTETIEDSIGAFVLRELEKGTLNPNQAQELSEILKARFHQGKMNPLLKAYKNLSYIDTMGSPVSAITQLGGLSYSMSNNGVYRTLKAIPGALLDKTQINLQDVGIDRIAEEFTDGGTTGNAVRKVFKLVGLQKLDRMDKLTFLNSTLSRYHDLAKKPTKEFKASLENIFEEETDQVISDLQNGVNSENVKLLLFNEILDIQPLAKSEMPELYLSNPNGRIFYMLKTFTLKQYDIYRKQVFDEIRSGNTTKGLTNLTRLVAFFVMMNAGASFLKDLVLGRDTPPEDAVVNTIAQVFGFSKYQVYSVRREGFGTAAFKTLAPPFKAIDSMSKDMAKAIDEGEVDIDELESVQSVPIAGKFYYWWFGAGADK